MQKLELNEENTETAEPQTGFLRRQFQKESTETQRKFDWIFGFTPLFSALVYLRGMESRIEVV